MILFNPATPIVRTALTPSAKSGNGPWQDTIDLLHSYLWGCFVALGGEMVMIDVDWLRPVDNLRDECELLIRKASNWNDKGCELINPTAARFSLIHTYRLLLHFGFVKEPVVVQERVVSIDLSDVLAQTSEMPLGNRNVLK